MNITLPLHRKRISLIVLALLLVISVPEIATAGDGTFTTNDGINGTFDFCVAVRFDATPTQIQQIQKAFQAASNIIADVTDGHHRFGRINIINNATPEDIASSEALIGPQLNTYGGATLPDNVVTYGIYGRHMLLGYGEFAQISLTFPTNQYDVHLNHAAFVVAHEFAHLAYSVADEYQGFDYTIPSSPKWVFFNANCAPGPNPGTFFEGNDDPDLNYCLMDDFKQRGGKSVTNTGNPKYKFSLDEFCVASNHDKPDQNGFNIVTGQSHVHKGKSCWETIASINKPWRLSAPGGLPDPVAPPPQPVTFTFNLKCGVRRVALLMDRSGSMTNGNRLAFAKLGANLFTNFYNDSFLAIVSFANLPKVDYPLTLINNDSSRTAAKTATNSLSAFGATNIGDGLQMAMEQLTGPCDVATVCSKTIILLTDGEHNVGTPPELVIGALLKAKIRVDVVALGRTISLPAEASLKNIANQTGGSYVRLNFFNTTGQPASESEASDLIGFFLRAAHDIKGDGMVAHRRDLITSGQTKEYPVPLEQGVTSATFALTKANQSDNITLALRSPSGSIINESGGSNIQFTSDSHSRTFRINAPQTGIWTVIATAGNITKGNVEVLSFAEHGGVQLNIWTTENMVVSPNAVTVYAAPIYETFGVIGATISGTVTRPDGSKVQINLFDDGNFNGHGDLAPSDGVYSANFSDYSGEGTYNFELTAVNSSGRQYEGEFGESTSTPSVPPFTRTNSTSVLVSGITSGDIVWIDDALPQGAIPHGDGETWHWVDANPGPFMGGAAHQSRIATGFHQHYFDGATAKLTISPGDKLFTYVFLDPDNMPKEILLQWNDGNWEHRAYWGENNINFGLDGTNSRRRIGDLPNPGGWVRLEVDASLVGLEGRTIHGMAFGVDGGRATWDHAGKGPHLPISVSPEVVWVNEALPSGATPDVVDDVWNWVSSNPAPFNGQLAHRTYFGNSGDPVKFRAHSFSGASVPMSIQPGDILFAYVYLDPTYTPNEIILQWHDGDGWEHRAFWGSNFVDLGIIGTESRRFMGGLPQAGQWIRLEVPASYVGLEGKSVTGMSFGLYREGGRGLATWDYAGKINVRSVDQLPLHATTPFYRFFGTDYNGYYYYSTNDIGRADQTVQRIQFYIFPNQAAGTVPLYRFRNTSKRYFYTTNRNGPQPPVWEYEAIAGYVYPDGSAPGTVPLYIFRGTHDYFFTTTYSEGSGMTYEGISCFVNDAQSLTPLAPSHLQLIKDQSGYLLTWRDNSSNETGFKIEHRATSGWSQIATTGANISDYRIGTVALEGSYRVRATNAAGDSAYSNEAVYVDENPGPAPTNLFAMATSGTSVFLTWTAPTGSISSYQVERSQSVNGPYTALSPNPSTTSFIDTTASPNTSYLYRVRAVYTGGGYSNYSNKDLATTIIFEDDPLNPNGTQTLIRAWHLIQLRQAVDAVRMLAGLGQSSWTYPDPVSAPIEQRRPIYLEDVSDLRLRLDEALTILNRLQPYPPDPPLVRYGFVSEAHFTQIRDRVR